MQGQPVPAQEKHSFYRRIINNTNITFSKNDTTLLEEGKKQAGSKNVKYTINPNNNHQLNCVRLYIELFKMTVGVLTTCHAQYT